MSDSNTDTIMAEYELREQDKWLPIANVSRIMKSALPVSAKISKEAKECMQECVSEFVSFVTSEASEKCIQERRKTVNGEDVLFALASLGFENYAEVLKIYLAKYRVKQNEKMEVRAAMRRRARLRLKEEKEGLMRQMQEYELAQNTLGMDMRNMESADPRDLMNESSDEVEDVKEDPINSSMFEDEQYTNITGY